MTLPLVAIFAWLPMPWEPLTSDTAGDWYAPFSLEVIDHEPSIEEIEKDLQRRNLRILENKTDVR